MLDRSRPVYGPRERECSATGKSQHLQTNTHTHMKSGCSAHGASSGKLIQAKTWSDLNSTGTETQYIYIHFNESRLIFTIMIFLLTHKGREVFLDIWGNNLAILNRVWITLLLGTWITYSTRKILNCLKISFDLVCKYFNFTKKHLNLLQDELESSYWEILSSLWLKLSRFNKGTRNITYY